jgi:nicotinamidase-related amidase
VSGEDTATDGGLTQAQAFKIEDACHEFLRDHPGDPAADEITDALAPVIASLVAQARAEERERIAVQNTHRNEAGDILYCPACGASAPEGYTTEQLSM